MTSESLRKEMVRLLKRQQQLDKDTSARERNWREYVQTREDYFMTIAREQGMTYSPVSDPISGVEQHRSDRRIGRQVQKLQ